MAVEQALKVISLLASADLSSYQYRFMKVDSNGKAALCGDGQWGIGVLQNDPAAADRAASIAVAGASKVEAGGTVTAGGAVASDANGRAVDAASGDYILGMALESATAAGQVVSVLLSPRPSTL